MKMVDDNLSMKDRGAAEAMVHLTNDDKLDEEVVVASRKTRVSRLKLEDSDDDDDKNGEEKPRDSEVSTDSITKVNPEDDGEGIELGNHVVRKSRKRIVRVEDTSDEEEDVSDRKGPKSADTDSLLRDATHLENGHDTADKSYGVENETANLKSLFANDDLFDAEESGDDEVSRCSSTKCNEEDEEISLDAIKKSAKKSLGKGQTRSSKPHRVKKDDLKELHSESQRLVREARVKLPYHQPEQRTLDDFLNRKKRAPLVLKPTLKESEVILQHYVKESLQHVKRNSKCKTEESKCNAVRKLDMDEVPLTAEVVPLATEEVPKSSAVFQESDGALGNPSEMKTLCVRGFEVAMDQCDGTSVMGQTSDQADEIDRTKKSEKNRVVHRSSEPTDTLTGIDGVSDVIRADEELCHEFDEPMACFRLPSLASPFEVEECSVAKSAETEEPVGQTATSAAPAPARISEEPRERMARLAIQTDEIPKLDGAPNMEISLDGDDEEPAVQYTGVQCLIRRFLTHTSTARGHSEPHLVELNILKKSKDADGEENLTTEKLLVRAGHKSDVATDVDVPGRKLTLLKSSLRAQIAKKRAEARLKAGDREVNDAVVDEEEEEMSVSSESGTESDVDEEEEEEEEEDEDLNDAPEDRGKRRSHAFLDDEAEEDADGGDLESEDEEMKLRLEGTDDEQSADLSGEAKVRPEGPNKLSEEPTELPKESTEPTDVDHRPSVRKSFWSRCSTMELFPGSQSPMKSQQASQLANERPSLVESASSDIGTETSFEMVGSLIPGHQPRGGVPRESKSPAKESEDAGLTPFLDRRLSTLSLPFEISQDDAGILPPPKSFGVSEHPPFRLHFPPVELDKRTASPSLSSTQIQAEFCLGDDGKGVSTQENLAELYDLCSGSWTNPANKSISALCDPSTQVDTQKNLEELMDLCSGQFPASCPVDSQPPLGSREDAAASVVPESDKLSAYRDSDEEDDVSLSTFTVCQRRRGSKRILSDDSKSDTAEVEGGDEADLEECEDDVAKGKNRVSEFIEDEAELSGSDVGSDEEAELAEDDYDVLEEELGDLEELSDSEIKDQVGRVHMKMMLDDDQRDLRFFKEMYLEDGDLHGEGPGRIRKFRWRNVDDDVDNGPKPTSDSETEEVDDAETQEFRLKRHEREKWLSEQRSCLEEDDDDAAAVEDLQFANIKKKVVLSRQSSFQTSATPSFQTPLENSKKVNLCGSFLARSKEALGKMMELTKGQSTENGKGSKNYRNFVFAAVSPTKPKEPPAKMRRLSSNPGHSEKAPPRLPKRLSMPTFGSQDSNSIFDLL